MVFTNNPNTSSNVNQFFKIGSLEIQAGYTATIALTADLEIAGGTGKNSSMANGTLGGAGKLTLHGGAAAGVVFTFTGGTILGGGTTIVSGPLRADKRRP